MINTNNVAKNICMELIPPDGHCIVTADGTIVWSDDVFNDWFSYRGIVPGVKISQLFPGERDLCRPGAVMEDSDRLGKKRYFALECKPTLGTGGEKVSERLRVRKVTLQKVLADIGKLSTQARTPRELFEKVLWLLRDTTHYLAFAGYLARGARIELAASKGWTEKLKSYISVQDIAPDSTSLAGRTAYHRRQVVLAMKDYVLLPEVKSAITKLGGEYIVVTPLIDQDRLVGVLTVINDKVLTPADFEALQSICGQVAIALSLKLSEEWAAGRADNAVLYANLIARALSDEIVLMRSAAGNQAAPGEADSLPHQAAAGVLHALNEDTGMEPPVPLKEAFAYAASNARRVAAAAQKKLSVRLSGGEHARVSPLFKFAMYEVFKNSVVHSPAQVVDVEARVVKERTGAFRLEISDNGPGIPDELKSEVFRPRKAGMKDTGGIGLYLVKKIANKNGGRVWIEDRVHGDHKKGTIVVVTIPVV